RIAGNDSGRAIWMNVRRWPACAKGLGPSEDASDDLGRTQLQLIRQWLLEYSQSRTVSKPEEEKGLRSNATASDGAKGSPDLGFAQTVFETCVSKGAEHE